MLLSLKIKYIQINRGKIHKTVGKLFPLVSETSVTIYRHELWPGQKTREGINDQAPSNSSHLLSTYYVPRTVLISVHVLLYSQQPVRHYNDHCISQVRKWRYKRG